jgi:hypothetical protein
MIADVGFLNPQARANAQATPMRGAASVRDMGVHPGKPFPHPRLPISKVRLSLPPASGWLSSQAYLDIVRKFPGSSWFQSRHWGFGCATEVAT